MRNGGLARLAQSAFDTALTARGGRGPRDWDDLPTEEKEAWIATIQFIRETLEFEET